MTDGTEENNLRSLAVFGQEGSASLPHALDSRDALLDRGGLAREGHIPAYLVHAFFSVFFVEIRFKFHSNSLVLALRSMGTASTMQRP